MGKVLPRKKMMESDKLEKWDGILAGKCCEEV